MNTSICITGRRSIFGDAAASGGGGRSGTGLGAGRPVTGRHSRCRPHLVQEGTYIQPGPARTIIGVYATGARRGGPFLLGSSPLSSGGSDSPGFEAVNPNVRWSTATNGFIGRTLGPIDRPPGRYLVCFLEQGTFAGFRTATGPVFFDVTG